MKKNKKRFIKFKLRYQFLLAILVSIIIGIIGAIVVGDLSENIIQLSVNLNIDKFEADVDKAFETAKEYIEVRKIGEKDIDELLELINVNDDLVMEIYYAERSRSEDQFLEDYEFVYGDDVIIKSQYYRNRYGHFIVIAQTKLVYTAYGIAIVGVLLAFVVFFVLSVTLFVSRKEKYLTKIATKVNEMSADGLYEELPVKGRDEISFLVKNINQMQATLREQFEKERHLEKTKNELIANVSHDLRTPLTTITGYLALINEEETLACEEKKKYIETALNKARSINDLIEQLFEYVTLSNSDEVIERVELDMSLYMEQVLFEYKYFLEEKGYSIEETLHDGEVFCRVSPERVNRVFANVFSNIIKHGSTDLPVSVKTAVKDNMFHIDIRNKIEDDQAIGVPDNVFNRYFTTDRNYNESGGLGLSIVKEIMRKHQGKVTASYNDHQFILGLQFPIDESHLLQFPNNS